MGQLEEIYADYMVSDDEEEDPVEASEADHFFEELPDSTVRIRKFFVAYATSLIESSKRTVSPELEMIEVPKAFFVDDAIYIVRDSHFHTYNTMDSIYRFNWQEPESSAKKIKRLKAPIPDSVFYFRKWALLGYNVKVAMQKKTDVPNTAEPEQMDYRYWPYGCDRLEDRKRYLMERYQESVEEHAKYLLTEVPRGKNFSEDHLRPDELLKFHTDNRHLHGFFKCERNKKSGERFLVDIYNRFKFSLDRWSKRWSDLELFDRVNRYYQNFSQFLRINHQTLRRQGVTGKYDLIDQVVTSAFLKYTDYSTRPEREDDAGVEYLTMSGDDEEDVIEEQVMSQHPAADPILIEREMDMGSPLISEVRMEIADPPDDSVTTGQSTSIAAPMDSSVMSGDSTSSGNSTVTCESFVSPIRKGDGQEVMESPAKKRRLERKEPREEPVEEPAEEPAEEPVEVPVEGLNNENEAITDDIWFSDNFMRKDRWLRTVFETREHCSDFPDSDGIPLLILKLLETEQPESRVITDLLDTDPCLRDVTESLAENTELFRKTVLAVCRLRQIAERKIENKAHSRELLNKMRSIVETVKKTNKHAVLMEFNRIKENLNDSRMDERPMIEPILEASYCLVELNRTSEMFVEHITEYACRLESKLDTEVVEPKAPTLNAGDVLGCLQSARRAFELAENQVESYTSKGESRLRKCQRAVDVEFMKKLGEWRKKQKETEDPAEIKQPKPPKKTKKRKANWQKTEKIKPEYNRLRFHAMHNDLSNILSAALKANSDGRLSIVRELIDVATRQVVPPKNDFAAPLELPPPPKKTDALCLLRLDRDVEPLSAKELEKGLDTLKNSKTEDAVKYLKKRMVFLRGRDLDADWEENMRMHPEWQLNARNIFTYESMEHIEAGRYQSASRSLKMAQKLLRTLFVDWGRHVARRGHRADYNDTSLNVTIEEKKTIQDAVVILIQESTHVNAEYFHEGSFNNVNPAIEKIESIQQKNVFYSSWIQIMQLVNYSQECEWADGFRAAVDIALVAIRNKLSAENGERHWLVRWDSSEPSDEDNLIRSAVRSRRQRNTGDELMRSLNSDQKHPLASFLYPFFQSFAFCVAMADWAGVGHLRSLLERVLRDAENAAGGREDRFIRMLVRLETAINAFLDLPGKRDEEVLARLVRFGMDLLASYRRIRRRIQFNEKPQVRLIPGRSRRGDGNENIEPGQDDMQLD